SAHLLSSQTENDGVAANLPPTYWLMIPNGLSKSSARDASPGLFTTNQLSAGSAPATAPTSALAIRCPIPSIQGAPAIQAKSTINLTDGAKTVSDPISPLKYLLPKSYTPTSS